ncbi:MAG: hypothetical protein JW891_16190 [Candidatus Lokiarchaeota archaeon]|nr:hypothetical protein [Candidatus Lokiarchaeota archaeon]
MSSEFEQKIGIITKRFEKFSNFIELENLRSYLLFTANSQVSSNVLAQMGFGNHKDVVILPYNPVSKVHYQKVNLITSGSLIIYVKSKPLSEKFLIEKNESFFKEYLNTNELNLAFRGSEKVIVPEMSDCNSHDEDSKIHIKIEDLFHSIESFFAVVEPNIVFLLQGQSNEPDILFSFNMMPEMSGIKSKNLLKIDVCLDYEHKTKGKNYIKREEDYSIEFMDDIKEVGHAELYKSAFSLILKVKSFNNPN